MFVEVSVCILFIGGYSLWLLLADRILGWRERRENERVQQFVAALNGTEIDPLLFRLGLPLEEFQGSSGKNLYVWRRPPNSALPAIKGVLTVTVTVENGLVAECNWQKR